MFMRPARRPVVFCRNGPSAMRRRAFLRLNAVWPGGQLRMKPPGSFGKRLRDRNRFVTFDFNTVVSALCLPAG